MTVMVTEAVQMGTLMTAEGLPIVLAYTTFVLRNVPLREICADVGRFVGGEEVECAL